MIDITNPTEEQIRETNGLSSQYVSLSNIENP